MKTALRMIMLACAVIVASPAYAQSADATGACKADVQTYCSGVQKGQGRIARCLKEHRESLSEGCKSAMKQMHAARKARQGGGTETACTGASAPSGAPADAPPAE